MKHTPGPWKYGTPNVEDYIDIDGNGSRITSICLDTSSIDFSASGDPNDTPENEVAERWANARLIAAAPDMLALLKELSAWLVCPDASPETVQQIKEAVDKEIARAAGKDATKPSSTCMDCGHSEEDHDNGTGIGRCWNGEAHGNTCGCQNFR